MNKFTHTVKTHPLSNGKPDTSRIIAEDTFSSYSDALYFMKALNDDMRYSTNGSYRLYAGCFDHETKKML